MSRDLHIFKGEVVKLMNIKIGTALVHVFMTFSILHIALRREFGVNE